MHQNLEIILHESFESIAPHAPQIFSYPALAIDIETTGLDPFTDSIVSVQIANDQDNTVHILDIRRDNFQPFFNWLNVYKGRVYFQEGKFDLKMLKTQFGVLYLDVYDTYLAEKILTLGIKEWGFGLDDLARGYLDIEIDKGIRKEFTLPLFSNLSLTRAQLEYGALDAWVLPRIAKQQEIKMREANLERIFDLEFKIVPVVAKMELHGFKLDVERWTKIYEEEAEKAERLKQEMFVIAGKGFNPNSPQQVKEVLKALGIQIPVIYGKETTKEEHIKRINHPFIRALLEYRGAAKNVSTYGKDFLENIHPVTGRIHAEFNQLGADTGRFSSDSPNMQNIPKRADGGTRFRRCFIAADGHKIISADFSQQEIRLMTEASRDPELLAIYQNGLDRHTATAARIFGVDYDKVTKAQRRTAKDVNFGTAYGASAWKLANVLGKPVKEVESWLNDYWNVYNVLQKWTRREGLLAWTRGYSETLWGRRRYYDTSRLRKDQVMRQGANHIIQGSAGDMIKLSMYYVDRGLNNFPAEINNQVHDELELESQEYYAEDVAMITKAEMQKAGSEFITVIDQPADVDIGDYWM